jgi:hypothetical protein
MKRLSALAALLFFIGSCTNQGSFEPTESEQRLMKAYGSLLVHSDRFGKTTNADSVALYRAQTDSLLAAHGFTRETFQSEFEALISTPERFEPLLRSIPANITKQSGT